MAVSVAVADVELAIDWDSNGSHMDAERVLGKLVEELSV